MKVSKIEKKYLSMTDTQRFKWGLTTKNAKELDFILNYKHRSSYKGAIKIFRTQIPKQDCLMYLGSISVAHFDLNFDFHRIIDWNYFWYFLRDDVHKEDIVEILISNGNKIVRDIAKMFLEEDINLKRVLKYIR